eukprot:14370546-Alexandrium_andersonii.AAC.1
MTGGQGHPAGGVQTRALGPPACGWAHRRHPGDSLGRSCFAGWRAEFPGAAVRFSLARPGPRSGRQGGVATLVPRPYQVVEALEHVP